MLRIGIFFGGTSREREISFAGGRTVYDNLNKSLFQAIPIFIDSLGNLIILDWQYIYKGTIRDFYPPVSALQESGQKSSESHFQLYIENLGDYAEQNIESIASKVGKLIQPHELKSIIDVAFLALHGPQGEDGAIQGLLEWFNIPYTGSSILPSAIGINKIAQDSLMRAAGFDRPAHKIVSRNSWLAMNLDARKRLQTEATLQLNYPIVVKAPAQGSSIGITILKDNDLQAFQKAIDRAFFIEEIDLEIWSRWQDNQRIEYIRKLIDIREGIGLPVHILDSKGLSLQKINNPHALIQFLNKSGTNGFIKMASIDGEESIMLESFISGKEFSCIVIEDDNGQVIALPPTQIIKQQDFFDYRSKYLPGMSRKITPINVPDRQIKVIRENCVALFKALRFDVYARIDGFITDSGDVFLNDPNTTSGMLPSSFFFHQAAEIGLNPSQFLTFIIRNSIAARIRSGKHINEFKLLLQQLDFSIEHIKTQNLEKKAIAVIMGGFSSERHISVESGRNIYEKLASSTTYTPIPVFLTGKEDSHELYIIPVQTMLKDNADDIKEKVSSKNKAHPVLEEIRAAASNITHKYAGQTSYKAEKITYNKLSQIIDAAFIALHGRPGEDGSVQKHLEKYNIPYNGSGVASSQITINKFVTNELLAQNGILVAAHRLIEKLEWSEHHIAIEYWIKQHLGYPFIAKPHDDGCSSAVKKIKNKEELYAFAEQIFRPSISLLEQPAETLHLKNGEEFPQKNAFLVEKLITREGADHFLEVTGGLLTKWVQNGKRTYEVFEPSEALASGEVLSLEEKFLAGEGQNITPARYSNQPRLQQKYAAQIKNTLGQVAAILNVEGYCRIDAFVRIYELEERAETIIIEVNSLPGMTPATCIFHQAALNHYKPYEFIDHILQYGVAKRNQNLL